MSGNVTLPLSGTVITSGSTYRLASGNIMPGYGPGTFVGDAPPRCARCDAQLHPNSGGYISTPVGVRLRQLGNEHWCLKCAGYTPREGFTGVEDGIRMAVPLPGAPDGIIADWLDDHGRHEAAAHLRDVIGRRTA